MWELDVRRFGGYATLEAVPRRPRRCEVYEREYAIHFPRGGAAGGAAAEDRPALRPAAPRAAPSTAPASAGSGRSGSRERRGAGTSTRSGAATGTTRSARSAAPSAPASACSTRRASPSTASRGPGAEACLDRLCANALPREAGRIALTQMCRPGGRDRVRPDGDTRSSRTASMSSRQPRPSSTTTPGSRRTCPTTARCDLENVTDALRRPHARRARARASSSSALTDADVSREAFPFFRAAAARTSAECRR